MFPPEGSNQGRRHATIWGLAGWDRIAAVFLPRAWFARRIARKIVRAYGRPAGPGDLTFQLLDWPVLEIIDASGHTRLFSRLGSRSHHG